MNVLACCSCLSSFLSIAIMECHRHLTYTIEMLFSTVLKAVSPRLEISKVVPSFYVCRGVTSVYMSLIVHMHANAPYPVMLMVYFCFCVQGSPLPRFWNCYEVLGLNQVRCCKERPLSTYYLPNHSLHALYAIFSAHAWCCASFPSNLLDGTRTYLITSFLK